jgi:hypothetical protein
MTSWMTDYLRETLGQYYTQRWYIYRKEAGSEVLCDYVPPTDNNSILSGSEWVRFTTTDTGFTPSADQNKQVLNSLLSDDLVVRKGDDCVCVKLMSKPLKRAHHGRVLADK